MVTAISTSAPLFRCSVGNAVQIILRVLPGNACNQGKGDRFRQRKSQINTPMCCLNAAKYTTTPWSLYAGIR
jgi:hypothetical protein